MSTILLVAVSSRLVSRRVGRVVARRRVVHEVMFHNVDGLRYDNA